MKDVTTQSSLLHAIAITKRFGGAAALTDVSLEIVPGEVHSLLGANGAGKSTLVKVIAGIHRADAGEIHWDGHVVHHHNLHDSMRAGIATMFQQLNVVEDLTVGQYLTLGREHTRLGLLRKSEGAVAARAALDQIGIELDPRRPAATLSVAERELVEIARAVSLDARLVIMDEPTASLGDAEVARLFEVINRLRSRDVAVLYVSHKLDEVLKISDRATVLRDGRLVGTVDARTATAESLLQLMVGQRETLVAEIRSIEPMPLLDLCEIRTDEGLHGVDLTLNEGEVLGVYGLMGAGRTELLRAIYGLDRLTGGTMELDGRPFYPRSPADAVRAGLGLVPEDRIREALIGEGSVATNITLAAPSKVTQSGLYNGGRARRLARDSIASLGIKATSESAPIGSLSGGNQQKVVLGRWFVAGSRILLLDDPTVGVDIKAKEDIYRIILAATRRGTSFILCSSELDELLKLADRILVMHRGRIVNSVFRADGQAEQLIRHSIVGADVHLSDRGPK